METTITGGGTVELKPITGEELKDIGDKHVLIVVSDGKIRIAELPKYGKVQINCSDGIVRQVEENTSTKFN